jgi:Ca2+/Na+ antiporter
MEAENNNSDILQAQPAPPEAAHWLAYLRQQREQTPQRLEEAAKFLSGMVSISFTIVAANIATQLAAHQGLSIAMLLTWLLSLFFAFWVIFPKQYKVVSNAADSIKAMHQQSVSNKYKLLAISVVLFFIALSLLFLLYLLPSATPSVYKTTRAITDSVQTTGK